MDTKQLFSVAGMVACITGGGTGIGRMMTTAFANNGAKRVYIVGRRKEKLDETFKLAPDIIVPLVGDVTSKESLLDLVDQIKADTGFLNLLCCNSGTMPPALKAKSGTASLAEYRKAALDSEVEDWAQTFATNTTSIFFNVFAFAELLDAGNVEGNCQGRKSQVIVTSSIAGYSRLPGSLGAYPASKAAATHMVKQLAGALVPYSIRVNALAPGLFPSDLAAGIIAGGGANKEPTEEGAFEKSFIPAERLGKSEDMIGTVLYMASAAGAYLNGNITVLDGGRITQLPATY
ncbi:hypothetical protein LTR78_001112 [Recurvomyces mirabilis]|uniref:Uncharacterized protein n=1 Tax=Recurvomyces mirabilis TaxID=574656 RepID=A0AAE0WXB8_9PEZI|nr:hypothetical protein LTR78_001112 [Recurvomyces mirabilis]KAK5159084.1 hypothetical protein LTS14_003192 [Recurvomyces mirabilis]